MLLDDLRSILLEERDSGELTTVSSDLFQKTSTDIRLLQQEVYSLEDPFSDEARLLIEKVSSIRATAEELFKIRIDKIVGLALSQAEGSYIEREELRALIPAELEMFNRIVEAIRQGRGQLIEWKAGQVTHIQKTGPEVVQPLSITVSDDLGEADRADDVLFEERELNAPSGAIV